MNFKKAWEEFWGSKHRHSYTHSAEAVRHNKILRTPLHYVELYGGKPNIFFDKETGKWICISVVTLKELNRGSIGSTSRKTGFGDTPEEAYKDWDKPFERIIE